MTATNAATATPAAASQLEYYGIRSQFKKAAAAQALTSAMIANFILARVILNQEEGAEDHELEQRGLEKLRKAFRPVANPRELANGRRRWDTLHRHLEAMAYDRFCGELLIEAETRRAISHMAKQLILDLRSSKS